MSKYASSDDRPAAFDLGDVQVDGAHMTVDARSNEASLEDRLAVSVGREGVSQRGLVSVGLFRSVARATERRET